MKDKACINCKNYIQHYCKRDTRIFEINFRHCSIKKKLAPCDKWAQALDKTAEDKENIISAVRRMQKRLDGIALYLSDSPQYPFSFLDKED